MIKLQNLFIMVLVFISLLAINCDKTAPNPPKITENPENSALQGQINTLRRELVGLKSKVSGLTDGTAVINTEDKAYGIANTKFGAFSVVCKNLTPYLDGYKAQLEIGNLTNAVFHGAGISIVWGENFDKTKEIAVTNKFPPGRYTNLEVVMTPAKPVEIKSILVTINLNLLSLN
jgi:hypothetical protein